MKLAGIVLIGGMSRRMGQPKALINFRGKELYRRTARLLQPYTDPVCVSGKPWQQKEWDIRDYPFLEDKYQDMGPVAGILSVFEHLQHEKLSLLIAATDMPLLDATLIGQLIKYRKPEKMATMFFHEDTGFLEPLFAIYEFSAYDRILESVRENKYAIHRMFDPTELCLIPLIRKRTLTNINYPEDLLKLEEE